MKLAIVLHIYQSPNQKKEILEQVVKESYRPVLDILRRNPRAKITLNAPGVLLEQLEKTGFGDVIDGLNNLLKEGKIELTGTAYTHALLPLLPLKEVESQIKKNIEVQKRFFPKAVVKGFFPPELAFGPRLTPVLKRFSFQWVLLDEMAVLNQKDTPHFYWLAKPKIKVVLRNRRVSKNIVSEKAVAIIKAMSRRSFSHLIVALDGETYGHHHKEGYKFLEAQFNLNHVEPILVTELLKSFEDKLTKLFPLSSTWETKKEEVHDNPFPLWKDPSNLIQNKFWELLDLAQLEFAKYEKEDYSGWARIHLFNAQASCWTWWASARPWWNPDMIVEGATEVVKVIRTLDPIPLRTKRKAETLYAQLLKKIWDRHWSKVHQ